MPKKDSGTPRQVHVTKIGNAEYGPGSWGFDLGNEVRPSPQHAGKNSHENFHLIVDKRASAV
jgi:hypothetical protein